MGATFDSRLADIAALLDAGPGIDETLAVLDLLESPPVSRFVLEEGKLYSETLPKGLDPPFTEAQRHLHFLWDYFDRLPLSLMVPFSIPLRRLLAERLFKACGMAFICEENVRFNFGQFLEAGDNVFFNRGCFLDTKGGIRLGDSVALAEDVRIFTHGHNEASHIERTYDPVTIGSYAKVFAGATILPGVTIGEQAIVASGALVTRDVPPGAVAAGIPAKVIRQRHTDGRSPEDLDHIWLF